MIQAKADGTDAGVLLQHPEHGVFRGSAERHVTVPLPIFPVQCDKRQQINGRFKNVELFTGTGVMEAASGIAALHIDAEGFADAVDAAFVSMTGSTGGIFSDKNNIMMFTGSTFEFFAALI